MPGGSEGELRELSVLLQSRTLACELKDKELLRALIDAAKRRPDSFFASAIGSALEELFETANMLRRIPRG